VELKQNYFVLVSVGIFGLEPQQTNLLKLVHQ